VTNGSSIALQDWFQIFIKMNIYIRIANNHTIKYLDVPKF